MRYLALIIFFLFSLNILVRIDDYLLWNDEGNTGAMAQRVLRYGVPLVDDGKTNLNVTLKKGNSICVKDSLNLYLCHGWAEFYVAAPFVFLGNLTNDLYLKTALIRTPFAFASIGGVLILYFTISRYLDNKEKPRFAAALFMLLILSVSYTLHSIEARYYSLVILSFSFYLSAYLKFKEKYSRKWLWAFLLIISSLFFYLSYHPAFYIVLFSTFIFEVFLSLLYKKVSKKKLGMLIFIGLITLPLSLFFETFKTSKELTDFTSLLFFGSKNFSFRFQLWNLGKTLEYLFKHEYLFVVLTTKIILFYITYSQSSFTALLYPRRAGFSRSLNKKFKEEILKNNLLNISIYFFIIYVIYIVVITRVPVLFIRYYFLLIPLGIASILVDSICILRVLSPEAKKAYQYFLVSILVISSIFKLPSWWGNVYELTYDYVGPMDLILTEIDGRYKNKKDLVIATNYASYTYVFYFDSKVVVENGYSEDFKDEEVDVVIPRKNHFYEDELNKIIAKGDFEKVTLDILDYGYNNIAELPEHLFKTPTTQIEEDKVQMYFRKNN